MHKHCFASKSLVSLVILSLAAVARSQTPASATIGGGSVNWDWTYASQGTCPVDGNPRNLQTIWAWTFTDFSVTVDGVTTPQSGSVAYLVSPGAPPYCPPSGPTGYPIFAASNYVVDFTPGYNGQGTAIQYNKGTIDPAFLVQSILYAPPGDKSSNSFTNSQTDGTSTSVGASFTQGSTETVGGGFSFAGIGSTLSWITGEADTSGYNQATTNTISNAASVGIASTVNKMSHLQDLFIIWLNPEINFQANSANSGTYNIETQLQGANDPEPDSSQGVDSVEVTAQTLVTGSVDPQFLEPQSLHDPNTNSNYSVPGLASICKNLIVSEYQSHSCTMADQCGCQTSDWAPILAQDPLLNYSNTESPLDANTSSASECSGTGLSSSSKCRYVYVGETSLLGPECQGCDIPTNSQAWSDSNLGTYTLSESNATTSGYSWNVKFAPGGAGPTITNQNTLTTTTSESTGSINGYAHSAQLTLETDKALCDEPILVYMDTTYHTFLFQENATQDGTCD